MHLFKKLTLLLCASLLATTSFAQTETDDMDSTASGHREKSGRDIGISMGDGRQTPGPVRRWYLSNAFDGAIFSSAVFERPGRSRYLLPTIRFSLLNIGYHFNYDFDEHFGIFTGLGIKNLGFIEKVDRGDDQDDSTIKRRVYTIGVPIGFKIGNLQKRHYFFLGGGFDVPFNYREKGFVKRNDKAKFNEWFSDRTPHVMPYLFAGLSYHSGSTVKLQYYPGNFFNPEFEETTNGITTRPYRGYSAHIVSITFGFDIHSKPHMPKKQENDEDAPAPAEM